VKDNSGRAVRREVPMDYEQAKARWLKVVAGVFPQLSFPYGQVLQSGGGGGGAGGGGSGQAGGCGRGQKAAAESRVTGGGGQRTPARYNGLSVCFYYNTKDGCKRPAQGVMAYKDGANVFAHVCNFFIKGAAGQHCLAAHPRFGNHKHRLLAVLVSIWLSEVCVSLFLFINCGNETDRFILFQHICYGIKDFTASVAIIVLD
jgi:hypothetical protein